MERYCDKTSLHTIYVLSIVTSYDYHLMIVKGVHPWRDTVI